MSASDLQAVSYYMLRTAGFVMLIRGALLSIGRDQSACTSSGVMAAAFFIAAAGTWSNP